MNIREGRRLVPFHRLLRLLEPDFEIPSLELVGARDHVPHVLVDCVEMDHSVVRTRRKLKNAVNDKQELKYLPLIRSLIVINLGLADLIELGDRRQLLNLDALLHQGHVLLRHVVAYTQVLLGLLEHDLERLPSKALLGHALNASYIIPSRCIDLLYILGEDIEA